MIWIELALSGLPIGAVYGLIGLGFSLIYAATRILNFAQGDLLALGAVTGYVVYVTFDLPFPLAIACAALAAALVGAILERVVIRRMRRVGARSVNVLVTTLGAAIVIRNALLVGFGSQPQAYPNVYGNATHHLGGLTISAGNLWVFAVSVGLVALFEMFIYRTWSGRAIRAVANDPVAARLMGVSVDRAITASFAVSAAVAAVGGVLIAPLVFVNYDMGVSLGLAGFVAAVAGGLGNLEGAVLGGLLLGVIESLATNVIPNGYTDAVAFAILILLLIRFPNGVLERITSRLVRVYA